MEQVPCLKCFWVQLKQIQLRLRNGIWNAGFRIFNLTRLITKRTSLKFVEKHEAAFSGLYVCVF